MSGRWGCVCRHINKEQQFTALHFSSLGLTDAICSMLTLTQSSETFLHSCFGFGLLNAQELLQFGSRWPTFPRGAPSVH